MPPSPIPAPLPIWAKFAYYALPIIWPVGEALLDYFKTAPAPADLEWRKLVLTYQRATPAGTVEDHAQIGFDFVNITGGSVDTSWITSDYTTIEAAVDTWVAAVKTMQHTSHTLDGFRWYRMKFLDPMLPNKRFEDSGPPVRLTTRSVPGTNVNLPLPYQMAFSVTERTAVPKHWGRFYLPGVVSTDANGTGGRIGTTPRTTLANATAAMYSTCAAAELFPVVPVTQVNKVLGGALLGITDVVVDDIPDVIRRRRPKQAAARTVGTH